MQAAPEVNQQRIWIDGLNRGDVSAANDVFAPECTVHITGVANAIRGVEAWKAFVSGYLSALPDLAFTLEEQIVTEDRVASRWHARGTHTGALGAVPPTGRAVSFDGLILDHLVAGMIVERWEQWDQSVMLEQLGLA